MRAMSLVYTTLLSLVPLLAFSFSLLKGFGVHNQVEPLLLSLLEPLGEGGILVAEQIMSFVGNIKVGVLGSVGLGVLLYTVSSLIHKMIKAIDYTWNGRGERSFLNRLGIYMLMIMLGPLVLFSVAGAVSTVVEASWVQHLLETQVIGSVYALLLSWTPFLLVVVMLSLIYWVLPGKRVHWYTALAGGFLAAVLWKLLGWIFATVVVGSAKYTAIYSAFASALLFMIWLHLSWLVLLLGSRFVYYLEHPCNMRAGIVQQAISPRRMLDVLYRIVSGFYQHSGGVEAVELARQTGIGEDQLETLIEPLRERGIVLRTGDVAGTFLPARSPDQILLADVVELVHDWRSGDTSEAGSEHPAVTALLARLDQSVRSGLSGQTLADWVRQSG
jgi:membrane protein